LLGRQGRCKQCGQVFPLFDSGSGSNHSGSATDRPSLVSLAPVPSSAQASWPTAESADELPELFGRYRILRRLGRGGMGAVYLAHDTLLGRNVALKVPHFDRDAAPEVLERFEREARAAATFDHPN